MVSNIVNSIIKKLDITKIDLINNNNKLLVKTAYQTENKQEGGH